MDINSELLVAGMGFKEDDVLHVAPLLLLILRLNFTDSIWIPERREAQPNAEKLMKAFHRRFLDLVMHVTDLEQVDLGVSARAPLNKDENRMSELWYKCLILVAQNINLRRRRLDVLKQEAETFQWVNRDDAGIMREAHNRRVQISSSIAKAAKKTRGRRLQNLSPDAATLPRRCRQWHDIFAGQAQHAFECCCDVYANIRIDEIVFREY